MLAALSSAWSPRSTARASRAPAGLSVYFPNSQLYSNAGGRRHSRILRWPAALPDESLWDDFLAFHYTGRSFEPADAHRGGAGPRQ